MKITLIQLPTLSLELAGYLNRPIRLGNIYRKIMPCSLPRVASIMEKELNWEVNILDTKIQMPKNEEIYKMIDWEGWKIKAIKIGAPFSYTTDAIKNSEWLGISSHFTFESHIARDYIQYAKKINNRIKIMVGGADASIRPAEYVKFGADLVFTGDFQPKQCLNNKYPKIYGPFRYDINKLINPSFNKLEYLSKYCESHDGPIPNNIKAPVAFIYFTKGCLRECPFCESRQSKYDILSLKNGIKLLDNYKKAGVKTLNIVDDNLLLQKSFDKQNRDKIIAWFKHARQLNFAWEFPNGLEVGQLFNGKKIDEELANAIFYHKKISKTNKFIGAYRLYFPIETFKNRKYLNKLRPLHEQTQLIEWLVKYDIPEISFGVIIPPHANEQTFKNIENEYQDIKKIINQPNSVTKARYGIFHLIPISLFRKMKTKYSIDEFPEGWNFYTPVYDGTNYTAGELFKERMLLTEKIDPNNYTAMMTGKYGYER